MPYPGTNVYNPTCKKDPPAFSSGLPVPEHDRPLGPVDFMRDVDLREMLTYERC
jgi:hypothetical protein